MSGDAAPLQFVPTLPPEEAARANFYGLLARLFYAPPDAELLAALAGAEEIVTEAQAGEGAASLALAWRDLMLAAAASDAESAREEYETLFIGVGKAPISLYAGAYLMKSAIDSPLVDIRDYLAAHGLARRSSVNEPEDHVAALCEVMRHLVAQQQAPIGEQSKFFMRFLWPSAIPLCDAVRRMESAHLYKQVAMFARSFLAIEFDSFRM
jgi:TorA maturation chaperone TorD